MHASESDWPVGRLRDSREKDVAQRLRTSDHGYNRTASSRLRTRDGPGRMSTLHPFAGFRPGWWRTREDGPLLATDVRTGNVAIRQGPPALVAEGAQRTGQPARPSGRQSKRWPVG